MANPVTNIQCPNCGGKAAENYCPRCGQAMQLHDDTFLSLVSHFFAHYFHYESKFWKTIGTLITKPGALTIAYHKKQRARYVAPMSLYIFVVIAHFLISGLAGHLYETQGWSQTAREEKLEEQRRAARKETSDKPGVLVRVYGENAGTKIERALDDPAFEQKLTGYSTKIFFFMIPVLALILGALFFYKKQFRFVDHAVFAFHINSFWFIIITIPEVLDFLPVYSMLTGIAVLVMLLYTSIAMRKVYAISRFGAVACSAVTIGLYFIALVAVLLFAILLLY